MLNSVRRALKRLLPYAEGYSRGWSSSGSPRVLFASGMDGAPLRYRVTHQAEQIALTGGSWMLVRDTDSRLVRHGQECDILYLYKAGLTPQVGQAIAEARARALPVVYDTDDLNWDERLVDYCDLERYYSQAEVARFRRIFHEAERLMKTVDCFVASTDYLAAALTAHFGIPAYVNANALSQQTLALAEPIYRQRSATSQHAAVTLGYFSGWPKAHESDLAVALPAVRRVLDEVRGSRLRIVGHFDRNALPADLRDRVEMAPFVPYERLFAEIARVDINLAPLVDNPHRRAKSAVKFLEAALVGVPTVASDLEPYRLIAHGRTGMLAADEEGWYASIMALATDPARRRAIGDAARRYVLDHETTVVRAPAFVRLLNYLTEKRRSG
ncbi:MAG: glycosyltransferase [Roseiflexaceae bacterium]|nr:glycosyltransferase [Roseiflexaceae bacterium]